ncbi:MAG: tRNA (guanosine(37)-N1)-methyltransferase TrmD [Burkholderiales bacterium]|nr:tRNA (guanosine(37)-N1)-methyltransferase TrmD [Burkholderiales bacterium]
MWQGARSESTGLESSEVPSYAVVAVYPEIVDTALAAGVVGRARSSNRWRFQSISLRTEAERLGVRLDTRPRGGGPGMLLRPDVLDAAIARAEQWHGRRAKRVVLSADGAPLKQKTVETLSRERALTIIAGRYEGFDDHWLRHCGAELVSIGDFVLSGGELAAAVLLDAIVRILPGVLGDAESAELDSFSTGLLDYPNFASEGAEQAATALERFSGNHSAIARWRRLQALLRTLERRPDVLAQARLTAADRSALRAALARGSDSV